MSVPLLLGAALLAWTFVCCTAVKLWLERQDRIHRASQTQKELEDLERWIADYEVRQQNRRVG